MDSVKKYSIGDDSVYKVNVDKNKYNNYIESFESYSAPKNLWGIKSNANDDEAVIYVTIKDNMINGITFDLGDTEKMESYIINYGEYDKISAKTPIEISADFY